MFIACVKELKLSISFVSICFSAQQFSESVEKWIFSYMQASNKVRIFCTADTGKKEKTLE